MGNVPEEHSRDLTPLAQLPPKPLPALPLDPLHGVSSSSPFMQLTQRDLRGRFEASVTPTNRDTSNANESDSNTDYSPRLEPWALDAPSPPNYGEGRDPSPGVMDSAAFQAVLDHEWGTAFHIPGNISPQSSIMEDPFMKMVEQLDPVFNRNRYAWTFKKIPTVKRPRPNETLRNAENDEDSSAQEKEGSKTPEKDQPEVITWSCQNVGQYGLWPGRTTANGEHRRPSVLYAISGEGGKRRGPTYLIHKHSRCHAFSIFQGYQVTGQKILASHAMLLSNKAIQYSFATSPEHKTSKKPQRPHEPYEDDPEVMKLQTHHLVEDDNDVPTTTPPRMRGHTIDASAGTGSPRPSPMRHTSATPERTLSRKGSNDVLRQMPRAGPASFAPVENPYPQVPAYAEPEGSTATNSTITPIPKPTPHSVAFDAVDPTAIQHHQHQQALTRASSTRFEWFKRAFGTGRPVGTAPRYPSHNGAPQQSIDSTYSPPWLLMAPQSVKQEEERIIQNLNDSFRAVGLIPPPKPRTPQPTPRARKTKPRSPILDSIPRDAMMMLMPLWIAEGGNAAGVSKHHVPMTERTYLLVYFVPFDSSLKSTDSGRGSSKKRTRRDRDRSERKKSIAIPSEGTVLSPTEEEDTVAESMVSDQTQKKPKKCSFRVVARMLSYADVRECGIKLPRFGLAVHGSLSDALLGNPTYHAVGENYSAVVAVCHGAEQGIELVTEGLDKLGLRKTAVSSADEQQIALAAMQMDREAMEEEHEARQQPLTPIGKSVVEMIFAGCTSILEIGFR
ncbi:hypothetical protein CPB86DRAFT_701448 [Serendipita vermifera]|nr:hypothetical protein CPB86DRAFT_701448 [Serendipita vermifera]